MLRKLKTTGNLFNCNADTLFLWNYTLLKKINAFFGSITLLQKTSYEKKVSSFSEHAGKCIFGFVFLAYLEDVTGKQHQPECVRTEQQQDNEK